MQNAFQQAQQAQQFGSTLGVQGSQAANQAAATLGQLGQTQFGQQKDIINAQAAAGAQQQALEQQKLNQQYQDFQINVVRRNRTWRLCRTYCVVYLLDNRLNNNTQLQHLAYHRQQV
jgi:hypothetical protein